MLRRDEHDAYERDLPDHQKRLDHANSRIQLLKYGPCFFLLSKETPDDSMMTDTKLAHSVADGDSVSRSNVGVHRDHLDKRLDVLTGDYSLLTIYLRPKGKGHDEAAWCYPGQHQEAPPHAGKHAVKLIRL